MPHLYSCWRVPQNNSYSHIAYVNLTSFSAVSQLEPCKIGSTKTPGDGFHKKKGQTNHNLQEKKDELQIGQHLEVYISLHNLT